MAQAQSDLPLSRFRELGWDALSDEEILELALAPYRNKASALRTTRSVVSRLPEKFQPWRLTTRRLLEAGLDRQAALSFRAAMILGARSSWPDLQDQQNFRSSRQVFEFFSPRFEQLKKECFWNVLLDGKNRVLRLIKVSEGSLTSSLVHPREVFRAAIEEAAAGVLFVHNHPSGDPEPSQEDREVTRRLVETGRIVGIRVLDHVIIGACRHYSFADHQML